MASFSIWHILILLIISVVFIVPIANILGRAGWSRWISILWLIPFVNVVMLWVFAYAPWPALPTKSL